MDLSKYRISEESEVSLESELKDFCEHEGLDYKTALETIEAFENGEEVFKAPPSMDVVYPIFQPSMEDFSETAMKYIEKIIEFFKRILNWLKDQLSATNAISKNIHRQIKKLNNATQSDINNSGKGPILVKNTTYISVNYSVISAINELSIQLRNMQGVYEGYFQYHKHLRSTVGDIARSAAKINLNQKSDDATELLTKLRNSSPEYMLGKIRHGAIDEGRYSSSHFLGNRRIIITAPEVNPVDFKVVSRTKAALEYSSSNKHGRNKDRVPEKVEFDKFNLTTHRQIVNNLQDFDDLITKNVNAQIIRELNDLEKKLLDSVNALGAAYKRSNGGNITGQELSNMLNAVKTSGEWLMNPYHAMFDHYSKVMRTIIGIVSKNSLGSRLK